MRNIGWFLLALLLLWHAGPVWGSVLGVDLGTDNIVVCAPSVNTLQRTAGETGSGAGSAAEAINYNTVDVILNDHSKRKTANYFGFRGADRYIGSDALTLMYRFPDLMVPAVHHHVGMRHAEAEADYLGFFNALHYPFSRSASFSLPSGQGVKQAARHNGTIILYPNIADVPPYSAEHILAMMLDMIKRTAQANSYYKEPVREAVLTVPLLFRPEQRQALLDAAAMAGLRVLSVMHSTTAAALQYGIQNNGFQEDPGYDQQRGKMVMIIDMGAAFTHVGIFQYSRPNPTQKSTKAEAQHARLSTALGTLRALSLVASTEVSGRRIDACIAEQIEEEIMRKHKGHKGILEGKTLQQRKTLAALMRASNKVKEVLSANSVAPYTVEGAININNNAQDYTSQFTRQRLEKSCAQQASDKLRHLILSALQRTRDNAVHRQVPDEFWLTQLQLNDIDAVEIIGGGLRVPKLLKDLNQLLAESGRPGIAIARRMNSDEAACLGAGYRAVGLARTMAFKSFALQDTFSISKDVYFNFSLFGGAGGRTIKLSELRPLFLANGKERQLPATRTVILRDLPPEADESVQLHFYFIGQAESAGQVSIAKSHQFNVSGIRALLDSVGFYSPFQTGTRFSAEDTTESRGAVFGNASYKIRIEVTMSEAGLLSLDSASLLLTYGVNKTIRARSSVGSNGSDSQSGSGNSSENEPKESPATVTRITTVRRVYPLGIAAVEPTSSMSLVVALEGKKLVRRLARRDSVKLAAAAARNEVETLLVWGRNDLMEWIGRQKKENNNAKESISQLLSEWSQWLDRTDDDSARKDEPVNGDDAEEELFHQVMNKHILQYEGKLKDMKKALKESLMKYFSRDILSSVLKKL